MTPQTEADWRQALAAVHPDGSSPDAEAFIRLNEAREAWRKVQPRICAYCPKPIPVAVIGGNKNSKYCGGYCSRKALTDSRRKPRKLTA